MTQADQASRNSAAPSETEPVPPPPEKRSRVADKAGEKEKAEDVAELRARLAKIEDLIGKLQSDSDHEVLAQALKEIRDIAENGSGCDAKEKVRAIRDMCDDERPFVEEEEGLIWPEAGWKAPEGFPSIKEDAFGLSTGQMMQVMYTSTMAAIMAAGCK